MPNEVAFFSSILALIGLNFHYLKTPSKFLRDKSLNCTLDGDNVRNWTNIIVFTSGIYLICAIHSFYFAQYHMAFLCFINWIGSSLYHRYNEALYFNFDNIFATSQIFIFIWSLCLASQLGHFEYVTLGIVAFPVAIFLLVYCGSPAEFILKENCCIRLSRSHYELWHTLWHLISGGGPFVASVYFTSLTSQQNRMVMGSDLYLDPHEIFPIVPTISLLLATLINLSLNKSGTFPQD